LRCGLVGCTMHKGLSLNMDPVGRESFACCVMWEQVSFS